MVIPLTAMAVVQVPAAQAARVEPAASSSTDAGIMIPPPCHLQARQDVPVHRTPYKSSAKIDWIALGQRITVNGCSSVTRGSYDRCGGGNTWYVWGGGYVATKCFRYVD